MNKDDQLNTPKNDINDYLHSLMKGVAGLTPIIGPFLTEIMDIIIIPQYRKRTEEWMDEVGEKLQEIQSNSQSFTIEKLKENEEFFDAFLFTYKSAMSTQSKLKKKKLLSALLNIALKKSNNQIANNIFLNLINNFNEAHLVICGIFKNPNSVREKTGALAIKETPRELIRKILPDLDDSIIDVIIKDLHDNGLIIISVDKLDEKHPFMQLPTTYLSNLGEQFIEFMKEPNHST